MNFDQKNCQRSGNYYYQLQIDCSSNVFYKYKYNYYLIDSRHFRFLPIDSDRKRATSAGCIQNCIYHKVIVSIPFCFHDKMTKYSFRFHKYKLDYSTDHLIPQTSVYTFARSQFNKNFDFIGAFKSRAHIRTQLILLSVPLYTFTLW